MIEIVKALVLPFLFILPIAWIRINNVEISLKEILGSQPFLLILLIPGLIIMMWPVLKNLRGQVPQVKR